MIELSKLPHAVSCLDAARWRVAYFWFHEEERESNPRRTTQFIGLKKAIAPKHTCRMHDNERSGYCLSRFFSELTASKIGQSR